MKSQKTRHGHYFVYRGRAFDERYGRIACMIEIDEEGKKERGRAPDYVQERTGHTRRSFSHSMTLNSNTFSNLTNSKRSDLPFSPDESAYIILTGSTYNRMR